MTGYPPRPPFRPVSFFFGFLAGLGVAVVIVTLIWVMNFYDGSRKHDAIAVSWGPPRSGSPLIYQAVVSALKKGGADYQVSARIHIGSDNYIHDVGSLGTAKTIEEALKNFGTIQWTSEEVTFGSATTVAAAVKRSELEKHR